LAVNQAKIKKLIKKNGKKKEVQKKKEHHNQENENNNKKEKEHHNKDNEHHNKATEHHNKKKEHHEGNAPPPRHAFVSSGAFSMAPQAWTWGVAALFAVFIPFMSSFLF
jgi:ABC-type Zn2+ transport system substrate-binding protein/surface adhesin